MSGNPKGRKAAGASVIEWMNALDEKGLSREELLAIVRAGKPPSKAAAALRLLRMMEDPDLADFVEAIEKGRSLEELRARGVPTRLIKRVRSRAHTTLSGEEVITREIELHDRSGKDFDRVLDRTLGKPRQTLEVESKLPAAVEIITPRTKAKGR